MTKRLELLSLLVLCILVLIFPIHVNNLYDTILGRLVLIAILVYFTLNNTTFGLLFALSVIISLSLYFREGLETMNDTTIGEENIETNNENMIKVLTKMEAEEEDKEGIDRQTIEESIRPVSSKEFNSNNNDNNNNEDVMPNDESVESFTQMGSIYN